MKATRGSRVARDPNFEVEDGLGNLDRSKGSEENPPSKDCATYKLRPGPSSDNTRSPVLTVRSTLSRKIAEQAF